MITLIVLIVLVSGYIGKLFLTSRICIKAIQREDAYVEIMAPNRYMSKAKYNFSISSGVVDYKISKNVGSKSVILEEIRMAFGLIPSQIAIMAREGRGSSNTSGQWRGKYWRMVIER
jgi:hypothetical protein